MSRISFAICLIAGLAVLASGCGSTKKATATTTDTTSTTASANTGATGATAPAGKGAQQATQSAGATHAPHTTAAEAKPEHHQAPAQPTPEQSTPKTKVQPVQPGVGSDERTPPHHYPKFIELDFIASCEAAKGSTSSCECILGKQEKSNVEKGQSIAELVGLEVAFKEGASLEGVTRHGVPAPSGVKRAAEQCAK